MGKKICKWPELKEKMAAWKIGSSFPKGTELGFDSPYGIAGWGGNFAIVQKGKLIGFTEGYLGYKQKKGKKIGKYEKLNKRYFPKLKCGLFSSTVKADVYFVTPKLHTFLSINCAKSGYGVSLALSVNLSVQDAYQVTNRLLEKTNSKYYTEKSMDGVCAELAKNACERIIPTLSFSPCRLTVNKSATSKEATEFLEKFKYVFSQDLAAIGYAVKFE